MTLSWISLLTFAATSLFIVSVGMFAYEWVFRYRFEIHDRLKEFSDDAGGDQSISLFKDIKRLRNQEYANARSIKERLQDLIDQSAIGCSPGTFLLWTLAGGAIAAGFGYWAAWWVAVGLMPLGAVVPLLVLYMRRSLRRRKLSRQLPEAFQMISRAVRAGQTVPAALRIIAEDFDAPVSEEFALCCEQQNLGISRDSALRKLALRTGIMELQIFVVAMLVQAKSGGDLVELLNNLASMIQKRIKLKDRIRALTGEGRMQAIVLLILPVAALVGIAVVSPEYAQTLFDRPWLLVGTAAAQVLGALWIRRIVNFEY